MVCLRLHQRVMPKCEVILARTLRRIDMLRLLVCSAPSIKVLTVAGLLLPLIASAPAQAQNDGWESVTGVDTLREFMSGLVAERKLPGGVVSRAEYKADGTGVLYSWGGQFSRTWEIRGEDQLCFTTDQRDFGCYELEKSTSDSSLYRVRGVATGNVYEFTDAEGVATASGRLMRSGPEAGPPRRRQPRSPRSCPIPTPLWVRSIPTSISSNTRGRRQVRVTRPLPRSLSSRACSTQWVAAPTFSCARLFRSSLISLFQHRTASRIKMWSSGTLATMRRSVSVFRGTTASMCLSPDWRARYPPPPMTRSACDQWLLGPELGGALVRKWGRRWTTCLPAVGRRRRRQL